MRGAPGVKYLWGNIFFIMMKSLMILTVLFSVAQTPKPAPTQAADPETSFTDGEKENAPSKQNPSAPIATPAYTNSQISEPNSNQRGGKDRWDKALVVSNYLLVAIGIGGVAAAICTLKKLERQNLIAARSARAARQSASAADKAAKAALEQVIHSIASERAWLVITSANMTEQGSMMYWWQVKNVGATPAKIVETQALCIISKTGAHDLPENPEFPTDTVRYQDRMLAPGDSIEFHTYWSGSDRKIIRVYDEVPINVFMVAYGYVKYRTVLDQDPHESRFCEYFDTSRINARAPGLAQKTTFRAKLDIPTSYTTHT